MFVCKSWITSGRLHALDLAESEQISIPPYIGFSKVPVSLLEIQRALPQIGGKTHKSAYEC